MQTGIYNPVLIGASFTIVLVTFYTMSDLCRRVASRSGTARVLWVVSGSFLVGVGIWASHFVGMLAYSSLTEMSYDVPVTTVSLLIGVATSMFAILVASRKNGSTVVLAFSSLALGAGIVTMHYSGMAAMQLRGTVEHDWIAVGVSLLIVTVAAFVVLKINFSVAWVGAPPLVRSKIITALLLGLAVSCTHYIGVAPGTYLASDFTAGATAIATDGTFEWLAVAIVLGTLLLLGITNLTLHFGFLFDEQENLSHELKVLVDRRTQELSQRTEELRTSKAKIKFEADARWRAQQECRRFSQILDRSANEIYTFDADTLRFVRVNRGACESLGYSAKQFMAMTPLDIEPLFNQSSFDGMLAQLRNGSESSLQFETIHKRADGTCYPVDIALQYTIVSDDPVFVAVVRDISGRVQAEGLVKASIARYEAAIELMPDAHIILDDHGYIQTFNAAAEKIFGHARENIVGQNVRVLISKLHDSAHDGYLSRYRETGKTRIMGARRESGFSARRKDGSEFPISLLVQEFKTDEGMFFSGIIRDISSRTQIEAHNRQLRAAVEQATDHIIIMTDDEAIEYLNPQVERDTGWTLAEMRGKNMADLGIRRSDPEIYEAAAAAMKRGEIWTGRLRSELRDGCISDSDVTISPLRDDLGEITHYLVVGRDVTEHVKLEQQLRQAQKLESIGQLAAGIAHEINTPSQYVGDNTRFLQEAFGDLDKLIGTLGKLMASGDDQISRDAIQQAFEEADTEYLREEIPRAIEQSLEGVHRVTKIVRAMKEFSHPTQEKTPVDLNRAIESTITVASNEWKYVAEMEMDLDPQLPPVVCLPGEFNQVILNIIVNASHAIADVVGDKGESKGTINVSTCHVDGWVEICIADTGAGMPENIQARIFDPFFTTKDVGKGTGQGLSIAHAVVVEKHGGTISVASESGRGTCFTIRLPLDLLSSDNVTAAA